MKRRDFLKKAGIGAVAASTVYGPVFAQTGGPRIRWRMATSWPRSLDTIFGGAETVAKRVNEMTEGRFQITAFPAGEIAPALEILNVVRQGNVEMGHTASYYYVGQNPSTAFDTSLPFGLTAPQQNAWLYYGGGLEAMQRMFTDFNLINFPAGNTGAQMGGWFKKEVQDAGDLRGLKFRIPGLGAQVWSRLGVSTQNIPGGEIFLALDRGAIDAAEWVGAYDDSRLGLQRAARFYYYPGWWEPGPTLSVYINLAKWRELPKDYQEIVKSAAAEANVTMLAEYDAKNGPAFTQLIQGGTQLRAYPRSILLAAERASTELYDEIASRDAAYRGILTGWRRFRDQVRRANAFNENSFADFIYSVR
ncbi:MAG: TRAP transporter substrate-binding protein DctP [Meiothermus sp.]|nr:TRAP transporter substrate-binding protein DctP [Meiothermus sp.]